MNPFKGILTAGQLLAMTVDPAKPCMSQYMVLPEQRETVIYKCVEDTPQNYVKRIDELMLALPEPSSPVTLEEFKTELAK